MGLCRSRESAQPAVERALASRAESGGGLAASLVSVVTLRGSTQLDVGNDHSDSAQRSGTPRKVRSARRGFHRIVVFLYLTGSAVPSDHHPAGTMNTSIGSGAPLNCGFSMTGDLDRSAPQTAPSMSGV